jgi:hypothetical protein
MRRCAHTAPHLLRMVVPPTRGLRRGAAAAAPVAGHHGGCTEATACKNERAHRSRDSMAASSTVTRASWTVEASCGSVSAGAASAPSGASSVTCGSAASRRSAMERSALSAVALAPTTTTRTSSASLRWYTSGGASARSGDGVTPGAGGRCWNTPPTVPAPAAATGAARSTGRRSAAAAAARMSRESAAKMGLMAHSASVAYAAGAYLPASMTAGSVNAFDTDASESGAASATTATTVSCIAPCMPCGLRRAAASAACAHACRRSAPQAVQRRQGWTGRSRQKGRASRPRPAHLPAALPLRVGLARTHETRSLAPAPACMHARNTLTCASTSLCSTPCRCQLAVGAAVRVLHVHCAVRVAHRCHTLWAAAVTPYEPVLCAGRPRSDACACMHTVQ